MAVRSHRHEIECVSTNKRRNPEHRLAVVGGRLADGRAWRLTTRMAVQGIEHGIWEFYVVYEGRQVDVVVGLATDGTKYLRLAGEEDGIAPLLRLPPCRF